MDNQLNVLWKKLSLNLESISVAEPGSIVPLIIELQNYIFTEDSKNLNKKLNFMAYELLSRCEGLSESNRKTLLTDYFFNEKSFLISDLSEKTLEINDWLLDKSLTNKQGVSFIVSILYMYFAQTLELPIYLINSQNDFVLKWIRGNDSTYLDITNNAAKIPEEEICKLLVKMNTDSSIPQDCFDILPPKGVITKYLKYLLNICNIKKEHQYCKPILDILLKIEPANLNYIYQRVFINKALNNNKEALSDIRKYYSLNGEKDAPKELQIAHYELHNLNTPRSFLLH